MIGWQNRSGEVAELVERGALEKRYARKGIAGSNPALSAYVPSTRDSGGRVR